MLADAAAFFIFAASPHGRQQAIISLLPDATLRYRYVAMLIQSAIFFASFAIDTPCLLPIIAADLPDIVTFTPLIFFDTLRCAYAASYDILRLFTPYAFAVTPLIFRRC